MKRRTGSETITGLRDEREIPERLEPKEHLQSVYKRCLNAWITLEPHRYGADTEQLRIGELSLGLTFLIRQFPI